MAALIAGAVVAVLAGLLHVVIFQLESLAWDGPRARRIFRTGTVEQARATKAMAFNQGFYNLFLAVLAIAGALCLAFGAAVVGVTLMLAGTGSMLAAALVLLLSSRSHRRAAIRQGTLPLIAVVLLLIGLALG